MLNNAEYSALFHFVQGWRLQEPTLELLFNFVNDAKKHKQNLDQKLNEVFVNDPFDPRAENPFMPKQENIARYHELNDEIAASELSVPIYAGGVVLVISGMLQQLRYEIDATADDWEKSAPLIEGCSVGAILVASGNNFRHNDEWARHRRPTKQQLQSIKVLAAAFNEPMAEDGSGHKFSRNICPESLELLGEGSFIGLASRVFSFAHNMVERRQRRT